MATTEIAGSYESESRGIQGQDSVEKKLAALRRAVEARIHTARDSYIVSDSQNTLSKDRADHFYNSPRQRSAGSRTLSGALSDSIAMALEAPWPGY